MKKIVLILITVFSGIKLSAGDLLCGIRNTSFQGGESLTYNIFYNVIGLYVNAGTATFNTSLEKMNNKSVYHVVASGATNSKYDWIFKVRDRYETFFDTTTLQPMKFIRNVDEGGYKKYENITFNQQTNTAITTDGVFKVPDCVHDVLSATYNARNIEFHKYQVGDRIPFKMFLDNEVYELYVRYLGKEVVKTRYGKFNCIKFKPLLLKGSLFEGGEKMTIWVSDDGNKIPIRIETPIIVGSVKVDMMQYRNLRYPLTSLISWR